MTQVSSSSAYMGVVQTYVCNHSRKKRNLYIISYIYRFFFPEKDKQLNVLVYHKMENGTILGEKN